MRFSTVFSVLACGAMALAAAVTPDVLVSRSNTEISSAVSALDQKCDAMLPQLDNCRDDMCTETIVLNIAAAIDATTAACVDVKGMISPSLGNQIAGVVIKIVTKLDQHKSSCDGNCGDLSVYAKIDLSISLWLKQLDICVSGILALVSTLLLNVVLILKGLCLNSILKVCLLI